MPIRVPLSSSFLKAPIAHRGMHDRKQGRIENSLLAFQAAIAAGYGIEIDLQLSSDGIAMVFHDYELDRLTFETGKVRTRTAQSLTSIRLRDSTDTIPTLLQVLDIVAGRVPLLIELRDQSLTMEQTDGRLETATVAALATYDGPVALMSFNPYTVAYLAEIAPHLPRGITTCAYDPTDNWHHLPAVTRDKLRGIRDYDLTQSSFICHDVNDLTRPRVAELRMQGAIVLCYTVRSPHAEAEARKIAQNIIFEDYTPPLFYLQAQVQEESKGNIVCCHHRDAQSPLQTWHAPREKRAPCGR